MTNVDELRKRHRAAARVKEDPTPETPSGGPETATGAFAGVTPGQVAGILSNAQERLSGGISVDVLATRRLASVLLRSAFVRQALIVTQRQKDYLAGDCPFPKEEVQALKVLADLAEGPPGYLPGEKAVDTPPDFDKWNWDL